MPARIACSTGLSGAVSGNWVCRATPGCAIIRGSRPRCGHEAAWTRNGWHRNTSPAWPVASAVGRPALASAAAVAASTQGSPSSPAGASTRAASTVRPGTDPGRRAGLVDVAEQVQHQQPAGPRIDVDPLVPVSLVAGLDVPARVTRVGQAREADRNGAAHTGPTPPAPGPDQLVEGLPQAGLVPASANGPPSGQAIRTTGSVQVPGSSVTPCRARLGPDHLPAGPHDIGGHRAREWRRTRRRRRTPPRWR